MSEDDINEVCDLIIDVFGEQWFPGNVGKREDGIINRDGDLYPYVCVVKGDNKTFYNGADEIDEVRDYIYETLDDSMTDPDGSGVWLVTAVVDTAARRVMYPEFRIGFGHGRPMGGYDAPLESLS